MPRPLPQPPTPFLGREVELHEIGRLLADPHCRLLTITGPGGMGKTRLALQTAVTQQPHFRDGVAYVSLRPLNSADFLAATIASALNSDPGRTARHPQPTAAPAGPARDADFLDNFEHLLDGVDLIADILAQAGGIKLLVTSRQRLDLQEEWSFALGEFNLPAAPVAEEMESSSAVALFVQSARRADSSFNLTPADYTAVARICRLVGGLPLGIELAASWTRLLSCNEIAQEIEQGLDFLSRQHAQYAGAAPEFAGRF
jgi:predicted ATPase